MSTISKGKLSKLVLLAVSVFLLFNFSSCGKESPTEPEPPPPPAKTSLQGNVVGLIKGQPINLSSVKLCSSSGSVVVECQVNNDKFSNDDINHPLSCTRIRIISDEAYDRETNLRLTQGANNIVTLNMIEYDGVTGFSFEDYQTVGYTGGRSPRWEKYKPIFYVFDQSLFRIINSQYQKVGSFTPSQVDLNRIDDVIMNDVPIMSDSFISNPKIERESNKNPAPTGDLTQVQVYVIIIFRDDMPSGYGATTGHRHSNFDIYNGTVSVNINYPGLPRATFSQDICETIGYVDLLQKESYYSIFCDDEHGYISSDCPTDFDTQYINKIKYGRLPGNMSWMDIPDYDPLGSGTSGLLLHKVDPIYEPNPLNPFNQFQQPTFTPPKDKIHKKQILNKKLK